MSSLFAPLRTHGLTSLRVRHDWRDGRTFAIASKEWEPDRAFADYRRGFDHESALTASPRVLSALETQVLYAESGAAENLRELFELLREGRHQGTDLWLHPRRPVHVLSNMHSNVLGVANGRHAIRAGGIRRHGREDTEREVVVDGLNLARAMSFKNAAAGIPYGGSKICVHAEPVPLDDLEALGFLGWCIDRGRSYTGPDMGLLPEHADALRAHFTLNIVGGPAGALGPTGLPTAEGVLAAIQVAVQQRLDRSGFTGLSFAVQGLGAVGGPLLAMLLAAGAERVVVADQDADRCRDVLGALPAQSRDRVQVVTPDALLTQHVDVLSPNACGGVFGPDEIDQLRCEIVLGAANNQLRAVSQTQELALAERLHKRRILYVVDWVHNGAGVLAGREEYEHQQDASMARVRRALEPVCRDGVRDVLQEAEREGLTPTAVAYRRIERQIYPAAP